MRIAILSDTHGRQSAVCAALQHIADLDVEFILHCGDIDDAATVRLFPAHTHFVYGNCDDLYQHEIRQAVKEIGATLHEPFGCLELQDKTLAFLHGDDKSLMRDLERSDAFDFLFYGHTHVAAEHRVGRTRVINPGALYRATVKTFILLDLPGGAIKTVTLD
jgi:putative phosphoesterase